MIESSVIVTDREGKNLKEILENKPYNHGLLTNYFAMKLECEYLEDEYLSYQEIILYLDSLKKEDNSKVKGRTKIKD